jgi:hypothetical protein
MEVLHFSAPEHHIQRVIKKNVINFAYFAELHSCVDLIKFFIFVLKAVILRICTVQVI